MKEQFEHIKRFALQDNSSLTVTQLGEAIARMCDDAIHEFTEQSTKHTLSASDFCPECGELTAYHSLTCNWKESE